MINETMRSKEISENLPAMNTHAVSLVLEGRLADGLSWLHTCLDLAAELDRIGSLPVSDVDQVNEEEILSPISLDEVVDSRDPSDRSSPDNCFIFFRNIFVLEGLNEIKSQTSLMTVAQTMLFNLAVVYQELGLGSGDLKCLSESLRLYQLMLDIFSRVPSKAPLSLLEMSVYNNLGHLFAFFADKEGVLDMRSRLFDRLERSECHSDHWGFKHFFRCSLVMCTQIQNDVAAAA